MSVIRRRKTSKAFALEHEARRETPDSPTSGSDRQGAEAAPKRAPAAGHDAGRSSVSRSERIRRETIAMFAMARRGET